jgi:hypothetical protein
MIDYADATLSTLPPTWEPWVTAHVGTGETGELEGALAIDRRLRERCASHVGQSVRLHLLRLTRANPKSD